jgi:Kef-type K+ transport system membrane component KefB
MMILAIVLLLIEVAFAAQVSVLLTLLAFGALAKNMAWWPQVLPRHFSTLTAAFMIVLFALIGASLDPGTLGRAAPAALGLAAARTLSKVAACAITAVPSGLSLRKGLLLGVGLTPMSGLAIVLVEDTSAIYPNFGTQLLILVLAAVTILELVGPVLTRMALVSAKETREG